MKVYVVVSTRGFVKVYGTKEKAEEVAKNENYHANMCGNYEYFKVKEIEVE